jgi:hypothetical protein
MKKLFVLPLLAAMILGGALAVTAASTTDLSNQNWRAYNVKPATNSYWDINKAASVSGGGVQIPIAQFLSPTTGSFAVYLLDNYNVDLTGRTIAANVSWTSATSGAYVTRSSTCDTGAYVRLEFQDVTAGPYDSNDYWWSTVSLDLNTLTSGQLSASLADRTLWTNQSGKSATDTTANWVEWQGDTVAMSPYDGFSQAMKKVKQIGLSFGNACSYASGVAKIDGVGTFSLSSFTITPTP